MINPYTPALYYSFPDEALRDTAYTFCGVFLLTVIGTLDLKFSLILSSSLATATLIHSLSCALFKKIDMTQKASKIRKQEKFTYHVVYLVVGTLCFYLYGAVPVVCIALVLIGNAPRIIAKFQKAYR